NTADGKCEWLKQYVKAHLVTYRGFNEGKGIWGTWELKDVGMVYTGGFHIWPAGGADPTQPRLQGEAKVPPGAGLPGKGPRVGSRMTASGRPVGTRFRSCPGVT